MVPLASLLPLLLLLSSPSPADSAASYAPTNDSSCPSGSSSIRAAGTVLSSNTPQTLSPSEISYNQKRSSVLQPLWSNFYSSGPGSKTGYSASQLASAANNLPRVGIAVSGGGYRAAMFGAAALDAFDARNTTSVKLGTGGYLQLASYLSGLSGGSWAVSSFAANDWPMSRDLVFGNGGSSGGWLFQLDLSSPNLLGVVNVIQYLGNIFADLTLKAQALPGTVSLVDAWGRMIAYHFAPSTTLANFGDRSSPSAHAAGLSWADSITQGAAFSAAQVPIPIAVSCANPNGFVGLVIPNNVTVYEYNPWEFGSFDPQLASFVDISTMGSTYENGQTSKCISGYASFSFVVGTSGNIFNFAQPALQALVSGSAFFPILQGLFARIGATLSSTGFSVGIVPNPFKGLQSSSYEATSDNNIGLVDGGYNGENLPLSVLTVKARALDVMIALDAGGDPTSDPPNHPDGTALYATLNRSNIDIIYSKQGKTFPSLPDTQADFIDAGYNLRPTFFGCSEQEADVPLLLYIPNSPYPYKSQAGMNLSDPTGINFYTTQFTDSQVESFLDGAYSIVTKGFPTSTSDATAIDSNWSTCMACAVSERARVRANIDRSNACTSCFQRYCAGDIGTGKASATSNNGNGGGNTSGGSGIPRKTGAAVRLGSVERVRGMLLAAGVATVVAMLTA